MRASQPGSWPMTGLWIPVQPSTVPRMASHHPRSPVIAGLADFPMEPCRYVFHGHREELLGRDGACRQPAARLQPHDPSCSCSAASSPRRTRVDPGSISWAWPRHPTMTLKVVVKPGSGCLGRGHVRSHREMVPDDRLEVGPASFQQKTCFRKVTTANAIIESRRKATTSTGAQSAPRVSLPDRIRTMIGRWSTMPARFLGADLPWFGPLLLVAVAPTTASNRSGKCGERDGKTRNPEGQRPSGTRPDGDASARSGRDSEKDNVLVAPEGRGAIDVVRPSLVESQRPCTVHRGRGDSHAAEACKPLFRAARPWVNHGRTNEHENGKEHKRAKKQVDLKSERDRPAGAVLEIAGANWRMAAAIVGARRSHQDDPNENAMMAFDPVSRANGWALCHIDLRLDLYRCWCSGAASFVLGHRAWRVWNVRQD